MDHFAAIADERRQFADVLEGLSDEQLRTPSLCGAWTVHDVAAHLLMPIVTPLPVVLVAMVRSAGNFDRANVTITARIATRPAAEIAAELRARATSQFTPPGFGAIAPLTDVQIHGQDVRRPLGLRREFDPQRLVATLDFLLTKPATRAFVRKNRLAGLRFEATDLGWAAGDGPVVRGSGEALMMAMAGRSAALADLSGDGAAILAAR